jgi:PAS domain S-box-containing protein
LSFEQTRNPYLILVQIDTSKSQITKKADPILELVNQGVWSIGSDGATNFITESTAQLIGYSSHEITGEKITDYLNETDKYYELLSYCRDGVRRTQRLEFVHKNGSFIAIQANTHTVLDGSRNFLGLVITLENISKQTFAEKSLSYRLSMEEMIANISSRFIGISSNKVDSEIVNSLDMIEEFMGIRDCFLQLTLNTGNEALQYISGEMSWHSSNSKENKSENAIKPYYDNETMVVPLVSGKNRSVCSDAPKYVYQRMDGGDIKLIQLIGVIFITRLPQGIQAEIDFSEERLRYALFHRGCRH